MKAEKPKTQNSKSKSQLAPSSSGALTGVSKPKKDDDKKLRVDKSDRDSKALTSVKNISGSEESKVDKKGGKKGKDSNEKKRKKIKVDLQITSGEQDAALYEWVQLIDQRHPTDRINDTILTSVYKEMCEYNLILKSVPFEQAKVWRKIQKQRSNKRTFNERHSKSKSKSKDGKEKAGALKGDDKASQPTS